MLRDALLRNAPQHEGAINMRREADSVNVMPAKAGIQ